MEPELVEKWKARIVAEEVSVLSPAVQSGAQFLVGARNEEGTWGTYPGMERDLPSSAAALEALQSCESSEFEPVIRTSRITLRDHIRGQSTTLDLAGCTASLRILARAERNAELRDLVESIVSRVRSLGNGVGWGTPVTAVADTAEVLESLLPYPEFAKDLIESTVKVLVEARKKEDGGWPVSLGGKLSAPLPSALAICALAEADREHQDGALDDAARYLQTLLSRGWQALLSDLGSVQVVALVLRAAASLRAFPFDIVQQGVQSILDQSNADQAWGERKGGNSNVVATSACVLALSAAGANHLVSSRFALSAMTAAGTALQELNRELDLMRTNVRTQVARGTGAIIAENDRLNSKVSALEKEKEILLARVTLNERSLQQLQSVVTQRQEIAAGSDSLRRSLGWFDFLLRTFSRLPAWVSATAFVAVLAGLLSLNKSLLPERHLDFQAYLEYGGAAILVVLTVFIIMSLLKLALTRVTSIQVPGVEVSLGASDRRRVLRGLSGIVSEFSTGTRESFLHQLGGLRSLEPELRDATARSMARQFGEGTTYQDLRVFLTLFAGLSEDEQRDVVYSLREVPGRAAAS